jgi:hypothetical protein
MLDGMFFRTTTFIMVEVTLVLTRLLAWVFLFLFLFLFSSGVVCFVGDYSSARRILNEKQNRINLESTPARTEGREGHLFNWKIEKRKKKKI